MVVPAGIDELYAELNGYLSEIRVGEDGEHIWTSYERITAIQLRLTEIHNDLAVMEIMGEASSQAKKFRTMVVDPTIERLTEVARFESRKITGKNME